MDRGVRVGREGEGRNKRSKTEKWKDFFNCLLVYSSLSLPLSLSLPFSPSPAV
jgi:hypothetical protein